MIPPTFRAKLRVSGRIRPAPLRGLQRRGRRAWAPGPSPPHGEDSSWTADDQYGHLHCSGAAHLHVIDADDTAESVSKPANVTFRSPTASPVPGFGRHACSTAPHACPAGLAL
jgi:hypothetical protein